jgi:hypothetical protein
VRLSLDGMARRVLLVSTVVLLALGATGAGLWLSLRGPGPVSTERALSPGPTASLASPGEAERLTTQELRRKCGTLDVGSDPDRYGSHIRPQRGEPGDTVVVHGPTLRGEDWRYFPSDRLEVWWNTRVPSSEAPYEPIRPGPIKHLATVENMERCRFRTEFKVPDVRPGIYRVVTFVFHESGYGWFGEHRFRVTP